MSIRLMTDVWDTAVSPATTRLVLLALADQANDEGVCWPFMATIASRAGCGLSTARKACAELENQGLLRREFRKAEDGDNDRSIYVVNADKLAELAGAARSERGVAKKERGGPLKSGGGAAQIWRHNPQGTPKGEPKEDAATAASEAPSPKPVPYSPEFEAAWAAYGRKGAKRKAWLEWQRAIKRAPVEIISGAIPAYLASKPDPKFRKDFERFLSGDVWESADAAPIGSPAAAGAMTLDDADAWLGRQYQAGNVEAVVQRTGRPYRVPSAAETPPGQTPEQYQLAVARNWIKSNRVGLRRVLMGMEFKNGNEVQS
jgi:hypothetical protein